MMASSAPAPAYTMLWNHVGISSSLTPIRMRTSPQKGAAVLLEKVIVGPHVPVHHGVMAWPSAKGSISRKEYRPFSDDEGQTRQSGRELKVKNRPFAILQCGRVANPSFDNRQLKVQRFATRTPNFLPRTRGTTSKAYRAFGPDSRLIRDNDVGRKWREGTQTDQVSLPGGKTTKLALVGLFRRATCRE